MSKLYLFAIGGTGSRVLRSLTVLLSTGARFNTEKIVPMIIDTDVHNGDLDKCRRIIQNYRAIHNPIFKGVPRTEDSDHFFRTTIEMPRELNISGMHYGTLKDMLGFDALSSKGYSATKGLTELLFNAQNREMKLEKGFLGNPNVGSIVLKDAFESQAFKDFTQEFKQGDRIFIVNSIFGGTGAAGLPLLLNLFRSEKSNLNNSGYIRSAIIGGVTVLPYFEVSVEKYQNGESAINSNTFIAKTKAALSYYDKHITGLINALFYIGDTRKSNFENFDGGEEQKNPANLIELSAALAISEFLDYEPDAREKTDLATPHKFFEFGIHEDLDQVTINHLEGALKPVLDSIIKFKLFSVYLTNYLKEALDNKKLTWKNEIGADDNFYSNKLVKDLHDFASRYFYKWLHEVGLDQHGRRFAPFNTNYQTSVGDAERFQIAIDDKSIFNLVKEKPAIENSSFLKKDKIKFDLEFSRIVDDVLKQEKGSLEKRFSQLMNQGIEQIFKTRYPN